LSEESFHKKSAEDSWFGGMYHTLEWLITAFSVTLVFIVFEMQAYTIPTGSMADTLKGAHFRLRCPGCGHRYDYDFIPQRYGGSRNTTPGNNILIEPLVNRTRRQRVQSQPRCPSCGYYLEGRQKYPVMKGDRIFVLKCIYQFFEPKRWDVVVFKNPLNPGENYIKRLIAGPGETVELIDGDVYIDGRIVRKPAKVQEELWMCVCRNDYQPVNAALSGFNGHRWNQPFRNIEGSKWDLGAKGSMIFRLDESEGDFHEVTYDTSIGNDFRATYAYDSPSQYSLMPVCSDLMMEFYVDGLDRPDLIGVSLSKYGIEYRGRVSHSGELVIERVGEDAVSEELVRGEIDFSAIRRKFRFRFSNVDHELVLETGDEQLRYDLGHGRDDAGARREVMPRVGIFGHGGLVLSHVGVFRDIHYVSESTNKMMQVLQAGQGQAFELGEDEFFVLGDNSPASKDSRYWEEPGRGNGGNEYRQGTVPYDYLVGKAFFVYWPGPFKPFNDTKLVKFMERSGFVRFLKIFLNVPYLGGMKIIYGSSTLNL
jgi:signal peptidase I